MQGDLSPPNVIDVEASGFGRGSYPIEVGFVTAEGERFCSLIRPPLHWTHWDDEAAAVHGLSRELLAKYGRSVEEVALVLNQRLAGRLVYCDAWFYDFNWLAVLFDEAGSLQGFRLEHGRVVLEATGEFGHEPAQDPDVVLQVFQTMAQTGSRLGRDAEERLSEGLPLLSAHLEEGPAGTPALVNVLTDWRARATTAPFSVYST